jgi:undecaprenyl-diphosphatase
MPEGRRGAVARFDDAIERRLDRRRGHPWADRLFYGASALGEGSLVWHLVGVAQAALLPGRDPMSAVRLSILLMVEGVVVNGPIKAIFRRSRPEWTRDEPRPHHLRIPRTSSFPSGHASAALFAAVVLAAGPDPLWPLYFVVAAVVAASRCWVRIHHASDVLGGAIVGVALGLVAAQVWPAYPLG